MLNTVYVEMCLMCSIQCKYVHVGHYRVRFSVVGATAFHLFRELPLEVDGVRDDFASCMSERLIIYKNNIFSRNCRQALKISETISGRHNLIMMLLLSGWLYFLSPIRWATEMSLVSIWSCSFSRNFSMTIRPFDM